MRDFRDDRDRLVGQQMEMGDQPLRVMPEELAQDRALDKTANTLDQMAQGAGGGLTAQVLTKRVGQEQVREAVQLLKEYKSGKTMLEQRVIADQEWWRMRNWKMIRKEQKAKGPAQHLSNTAWLWNCIAAKHADAMDSYPEPVILPRAEDDKEEAKRLSEIVPVVLQQAGFEQTYSDAMWQKMQEGTGVYGVFWDASKLNGLGDISITKISVLNLFWQPGIQDIQESANVFLVKLWDNEQLEAQYPQLVGKLNQTSITLAKYAYDDEVDTSKKSMVIDWYYKRGNVLHMAKLAGDEVLYATEDDPELAERGLYDDGMYPFVMDVLFPVEGSPCGVGYIDIGKDSQADIDQLSTALVRNAIATSTPRYFKRQDGGVNDEEFLDWSKPLINSSSNLNEDNLRPIQVPSIGSGALTTYQEKIEELKFVTGNTDVNNGGTPSGVTAASAIAALQENSGRTSKDSNRSAYRAYSQLVNMVIERIRQHYDLPRQFRIVGQTGQDEYIQYSNAKLVAQSQGIDLGNDMGMRLPVFDVEVRAQKQTSYTKAAQNELAIQLYQLGIFNPQMVDQSLMMLDMMEFKGKDETARKLREMGTMQQLLQQVGAIALVLAGKYEPQTAMQVQQMLMSNPATAAMVQQQMAMAPMGVMGGGAQQQVPEGDAMKGSARQDDPSKAGKTRMDNMRERVNNSTRV